MMRIKFEEVTYRQQKNGNCPSCGKKVTKSKTFLQTINPWNLNINGLQKTRKEIFDELVEEADKWIPDFTHRKCRDT